MSFRIAYTRSTFRHDRALNRPAFYQFIDIETVDELNATMARLADDRSVKEASWTRCGAWWMNEHPIAVDHRGFISADDQRYDLELSGAFDEQTPVADADDRLPEGYGTDEYCPAAGGPHKPVWDKGSGWPTRIVTGECEHCGRPQPTPTRQEAQR